MYEVLNTFEWKLIPKFQWKLINFEKPQNLSQKKKKKTQNLGLKTWNEWMRKD